MGVLAIGLNDIGLCAARSGEDQLLTVDDGATFSPGYAWRDRDTLVTGVAAARRACLHPREIDNRFWDLCDTGPLDAKDRHSPNRAEVACDHLRRIGETLRPWEEDVVIAVPPFYDTTQLGILVAIARELALPLRGLVPTPLAIDREAETDGGTLIVDLSLHRCALSVVARGDGAALQRTRTVAGVGLNVYRRQWIKAIGDAFVRSTRFDPLHDGTTEQRLHDELPRILDALASSGDHEVELTSGSGAHRVTVTDRMLVHAGHELNGRICADVQAEVAAGGVTTLRVTHEPARVPGLMRMLASQIAIPVRALEAGAPALGLARTWPDQFEAAPTPGVAYHVHRKN